MNIATIRRKRRMIDLSTGISFWKLRYLMLVVALADAHSISDRTIPTNKERDLVLLQQPRIVGGVPADPGQYPFYVKTVPPTLCGGTLIAPDIVLTAAHCEGAFVNGIVIGGLFLNGTDAIEAIDVDTELPHPDFNGRLNDIMLVKLAQSSTLSPVVPLNFDTSTPVVDDVVTVIGFGDVTDGGDPSDVLRTVDVNVYADEECSNFQDFIAETQICAGTEMGGRDACQGDSGGPLLTSDNVQVGIVSVGSGCGVPDVPAIYTEVAAFESFIRQGICVLSDDPPADCVSPQPISTPISPPSDTSSPVSSPVSPPTTTPAPTNSPTTIPVDVPINPPLDVPIDLPIEAPIDVPVGTSSPTITFQPTITPQPTITAQPTVATIEPTIIPGPTMVTTTRPTIAPVTDEIPTTAPTQVDVPMFVPTPVNIIEPTVAPTPTDFLNEPTDAPMPINGMEPDEEPTMSPTSRIDTKAPTKEPNTPETEEPTTQSTFYETHPGKGKSNGKGGMMMMGKGKGGSNMGHNNGGMMMGKGKGGMMGKVVHYGKGYSYNENVLFRNDDDNDDNPSSSSDVYSNLFPLIQGPAP